MHGGKGFGGGEATRDPGPTYYDPNDPKGKQQAIHKAESFAEYLAKRGSAVSGGTTRDASPPPAPATPVVASSRPVARVQQRDARRGTSWHDGAASATSHDFLGNSMVQGSWSAAVPPRPRAVASPPAVDYAAIRKELKLMMDNPSWDDGSLAPIFIRLAWHSSGTFDKASGTGGSNGAGMRFSTEAADPENAGLNAARAFLEPVKKRFPAISYSDLWVLAAYVGLEHTGGPAIQFHPGRSDHQDENYWKEKGMSYGRLPAAEKYLGDEVDAEGRVVGWERLSTHVRHEVFYRMGFNDQEIVALLCGGHVYGRAHPKASGYAGPWVENPTVFSNEYAADMIEDEWFLVGHEDTWLDEQGAAELRPAPGKRQYVNQKRGGQAGDHPNQMMLVSDMILAWDPGFRPHLEVYAQSEERLKEDFGKAFKKLTELGGGF